MSLPGFKVKGISFSEVYTKCVKGVQTVPESDAVPKSDTVPVSDVIDIEMEAQDTTADKVIDVIEDF